MIKIFRRKQSASGSFARERLHTLLENDRSTLSGDKVLEKIKKEVSAVLLKYTTEAFPPEVKVTYSNGSQCNLAARILVKEKYIR